MKLDTTPSWELNEGCETFWTRDLKTNNKIYLFEND